jgi:tetratricopeptide (TPR) repeat protein
LKRKKAGDLLKVVCETLKPPGAGQEFEAVKPQLEAAAADDAMAEAMLDAGLQLLSAKPPGLPPKIANLILSLVAKSPERNSSNKNRRLEKLVKLEQLSLEQNPTPLAYRELADTLQRIGKYAEAASTVEKLIADYPNEKSVGTLVFLANFHRRAGHDEAFKAALREAMKLDPVDSESQRLLANLLSEIGQVDDAVKVLRDSIKREPNNAGSEIELGRILAKFGRNDEAVKIYEDLLKRLGVDDQFSTIVSGVHQMLSVIYVNQGNYAKGEAELEAALQRNPDEAGPNNDLGYLYAEQGKNLDKAELLIRKALQESPDQYEYLDSLGWVLFKRGKLKEALAEMQKAAEKMKTRIEQDGTPPDATILEHLGDVYFKLQELDKAGESWRQALKFGEKIVPPDKRMAEIRKKLESLDKLGPIPKASSNRTP